jgi:hypothetical protein
LEGGIILKEDINPGSMIPSKIAAGIVNRHYSEKVTSCGIGTTIEKEIEKCKQYWLRRGRIDGFRQARKILINLEAME